MNIPTVIRETLPFPSEKKTQWQRCHLPPIQSNTIKEKHTALVLNQWQLHQSAQSRPATDRQSAVVSVQLCGPSLQGLLSTFKKTSQRLLSRFIDPPRWGQVKSPLATGAPCFPPSRQLRYPPTSSGPAGGLQCTSPCKQLGVWQRRRDGRGLRLHRRHRRLWFHHRFCCSKWRQRPGWRSWLLLLNT